MGITSIPGGPHLEALAEEGEAAADAAGDAAAAATRAEGADDATTACAAAKARASVVAPFEVTMPMQVREYIEEYIRLHLHSDLFNLISSTSPKTRSLGAGGNCYADETGSHHRMLR
eukprot:354277-Chlamydomonas_euryale.AAC.3